MSTATSSQQTVENVPAITKDDSTNNTSTTTGHHQHHNGNRRRSSANIRHDSKSSYVQKVQPVPKKYVYDLTQLYDLGSLPASNEKPSGIPSFLLKDFKDDSNPIERERESAKAMMEAGKFPPRKGDRGTGPKKYPSRFEREGSGEGGRFFDSFKDREGHSRDSSFGERDRERGFGDRDYHRERRDSYSQSRDYHSNSNLNSAEDLWDISDISHPLRKDKTGTAGNQVATNSSNSSIPSNSTSKLNGKLGNSEPLELELAKARNDNENIVLSPQRIKGFPSSQQTNNKYVAKDSLRDGAKDIGKSSTMRDSKSSLLANPNGKPSRYGEKEVPTTTTQERWKVRDKTQTKESWAVKSTPTTNEKISNDAGLNAQKGSVSNTTTQQTPTATSKQRNYPNQAQYVPKNKPSDNSDDKPFTKLANNDDNLTEDTASKVNATTKRRKSNGNVTYVVKTDLNQQKSNAGTSNKVDGNIFSLDNLELNLTAGSNYLDESSFLKNIENASELDQMLEQKFKNKVDIWKAEDAENEAESMASKMDPSGKKSRGLARWFSFEDESENSTAVETSMYSIFGVNKGTTDSSLHDSSQFESSLFNKGSKLLKKVEQPEQSTNLSQASAQNNSDMEHTLPNQTKNTTKTAFSINSLLSSTRTSQADYALSEQDLLKQFIETSNPKTGLTVTTTITSSPITNTASTSSPTKDATVNVNNTPPNNIPSTPPTTTTTTTTTPPTTGSETKSKSRSLLSLIQDDKFLVNSTNNAPTHPTNPANSNMNFTAPFVNPLTMMMGKTPVNISMGPNTTVPQASLGPNFPMKTPFQPDAFPPQMLPNMHPNFNQQPPVMTGNKPGGFPMRPTPNMPMGMPNLNPNMTTIPNMRTSPMMQQKSPLGFPNANPVPNFLMANPHLMPQGNPNPNPNSNPNQPQEGLQRWFGGLNVKPNTGSPVKSEASSSAQPPKMMSLEELEAELACT